MIRKIPLNITLMYYRKISLHSKVMWSIACGDKSASAEKLKATHWLIREQYVWTSLFFFTSFAQQTFSLRKQILWYSEDIVTCTIAPCIREIMQHCAITNAVHECIITTEESRLKTFLLSRANCITEKEGFIIKRLFKWLPLFNLPNSKIQILLFKCAHFCLEDIYLSLYITFSWQFAKLGLSGVCATI